MIECFKIRFILVYNLNSRKNYYFGQIAKNIYIETF